MPSPNIVKQYREGGIYHIYNRGIDGREVFTDGQDYQNFLDCLRYYLAAEYDGDSKPRRKELAGRLDLIAYCLAPDHFHLVIQQHTTMAIADLMRCVTNAYIRYFNRRYDRVGPLFAGKYRAVLLEQDDQLLHLSRYLHKHSQGEAPSLLDYPYSSYAYYLRKVTPIWVNPTAVWEHFADGTAYRRFVEADLDSTEALGQLTLEPKLAGASK